MSYYSKDQLREKGKEIVEEAANATLREAESHKEAYREQQQEDGSYTGGPGQQKTAITDEEKAQLKDWVKNELDWIPDSIYAMGDPEPSGFDGMVSDTSDVAGKFGGTKGASADPNLAFADKAQAEIEEWDGAFSENFQNGFTIPFPKIQENQGKVGNMLYEAAKATQDLYKAKRTDVSKMCDQTIAALKACGERDGGDEKMALTILGAVAVVAGAALAVPSGGASAYAGALVCASIASGASVGGAAIKDEKDRPLGAPTVNEVISNMIDRMSDINTEISNQERDVCKGLDSNYEILTSIRSIAEKEKAVSPLSPMRPSIADADDPGSGLKPDD